MTLFNKTLIFLFSTAVLLAVGTLFIKNYDHDSGTDVTHLIPNPDTKDVENTEEEKPLSIFQKEPVINILLIGTDTSLERRNNGQYGYNTDATVLVSVNTTNKQVLLTSVPRDLWVNNGKINSLFAISGWDGLRNAYEEITSLTINGYISTDFDGFRWIVTQIGGIDVEVKNTFTDYSFSNQQDTDITEVTFEMGSEVMDGERALTYARSRKGTNGEGSDLMRAKRQHLLLEGILNSFNNSKNIFWPMDITGFFNTVTKHMDTNLSLEDAVYLWDFYKYKDQYKISSFVLDDRYLYHPGLYPESPYTAWVFIPRDPNYADVHEAIKKQLNGELLDTPDESVAPESQLTTTTETVN